MWGAVPAQPLLITAGGCERGFAEIPSPAAAPTPAWLDLVPGSLPSLLGCLLVKDSPHPHLEVPETITRGERAGGEGK